MPSTLTADARNRAWRTVLQGLAIDVLVAMAAVTLASVGEITDRAGITLLAITLAKTAVTAAASYLMRRYADGSAFVPTPLPPTAT